ncbi:hypothetical protein [Luteimonas changyuni]|uniref:hypothetical protein n=2 Tax=unclassified Luteimonas TaxID=2629088 RepID=UPI0031BA2AC9
MGDLSRPVNPMRRAASLLFAASCLLALSPSSDAAELGRVDVQGAVGMCRAITQADAAGIRYRPLALANESSGIARVACSWQGDDSPQTVRAAKRLAVTISNFGVVPVEVSCTLVNGHQTGALVYASYTPKTVAIAAGASAELAWLPGDVANSKPSGIDRPSVSCLLPPQAAMMHTTREYNENVGA